MTKQELEPVAFLCATCDKNLKPIEMWPVDEMFEGEGLRISHGICDPCAEETMRKYLESK